MIKMIICPGAMFLMEESFMLLYCIVCLWLILTVLLFLLMVALNYQAMQVMVKFPLSISSWIWELTFGFLNWFHLTWICFDMCSEDKPVWCWQPADEGLCTFYKISVAAFFFFSWNNCRRYFVILRILWNSISFLLSSPKGKLFDFWRNHVHIKSVCCWR